MAVSLPFDYRFFLDIKEKLLAMLAKSRDGVAERYAAIYVVQYLHGTLHRLGSELFACPHGLQASQSLQT